MSIIFKWKNKSSCFAYMKAWWFLAEWDSKSAPFTELVGIGICPYYTLEGIIFPSGDRKGSSSGGRASCCKEGRKSDDKFEKSMVLVIAPNPNSQFRKQHCTIPYCVYHIYTMVCLGRIGSYYLCTAWRTPHSQILCHPVSLTTHLSQLLRRCSKKQFVLSVNIFLSIGRHLIEILYHVGRTKLWHQLPHGVMTSSDSIIFGGDVDRTYRIGMMFDKMT